MTKASLRKRPGTLPEDGIYDVTGSLDGIQPGRRIVKHLEVRRLGGYTAEGLRPLTAFEDLRELDLVHTSDLDLTPLTELRLEGLSIDTGERLDLSPLSSMTDLVGLLLFDLVDCGVPDVLSLPATLRQLTIGVDGANRTGDPVRMLVNAIDWSGLPKLRSLALSVGGNEPLRPIEVDLGFLAELRELEDVDIRFGVWPDPRRPSPLDPPFEGLPRTIKSVSIESWTPDIVAAELSRYLDTNRVLVHQRYSIPTERCPWAIDPPEPGQAEWSMLGSLYDAFDGRDRERELATEEEALQAACRRIRVADAALLTRLDFDRDSSSTLITAPSRDDLEATLRLLRIAPGTRKS